MAGRKRHTVVDTLGLLVVVAVTAANVQNWDGAQLALRGLYRRLCDSWRLLKIWADGGYRGALIDWVKSVLGWSLEIVTKLGDQVGIQVLPKRWIEDRTFARLNRQRRLSKDYERLPQTSEAFVYVAMIRLKSRQLADG